nr:shewanella-like protein phosphatase 2 [Quercus suber]
MVKAGSEVITMNSNHKTLNMERDFRYMSESGWEEFRVWAEWYHVGQVMKCLCEGLENPKNRAIRIDVGMSKGCGGGFLKVLEISENSRLKVLTSNPLYQDKYLHRERKGRLGLLIPKQGPKQVEVKA